MVDILFTEKSQNLCRRSADGIEDGRDKGGGEGGEVLYVLNNMFVAPGRTSNIKTNIG